MTMHRPSQCDASDSGIHQRLTRVGFVLTLLSTGVAAVVAILVIMWRDPATGVHVLDTRVMTAAPIFVAAIFHAVGAGLLRLFGIEIWTDPENKMPSDDVG